MPRGGALRFLRDIRGSVAGAAFLLVIDGVFGGSFAFSLISCPVWFFVSLVRNEKQRPGWGLALARVAIPALTLILLRANGLYQLEVAEAHARQVIAACERFHADRGRYPMTLDELVPRYFESVPIAKHCLGRARHFSYFNFNSGGSPSFYWQVFGFYRKTYNFEFRRWGHLD